MIYELRHEVGWHWDLGSESYSACAVSELRFLAHEPTLTDSPGHETIVLQKKQMGSDGSLRLEPQNY